jgi:arylsulfatase
MEGKDAGNLDDPMVRKCIDLVSMWWAEAGKYQVLPMDDRFQARGVDREAL